MSSEILFIGGSHDGERLSVDPGRRQVMFPRPIADTVLYSRASYVAGTLTYDTQRSTHEVYKQCTIQGEGQKFVFFSLRDLSPDQALSMLIENYRVPK